MKLGLLAAWEVPFAIEHELLGCSGLSTGPLLHLNPTGGRCSSMRLPLALGPLTNQRIGSDALHDTQSCEGVRVLDACEHCGPCGGQPCWGVGGVVLVNTTPQLVYHLPKVVALLETEPEMDAISDVRRDQLTPVLAADLCAEFASGVEWPHCYRNGALVQDVDTASFNVRCLTASTVHMKSPRSPLATALNAT